ncbi:hypothetical protein AAVH_33720 [Aphelenchoides avenae]|nr:hypothetical protein AAVH_33720 [Aphelenchus avenae]
MNLRIDRTESLFSQQFAEANRPDPGRAPSSRKKETQTMDSLGLLVFILVVGGLIFFYIGPAIEAGQAEKRRRKAEDRRQLVEAVAERLAMEFKLGSVPPGSEKKPEDANDDASFENLELPANEN